MRRRVLILFVVSAFLVADGKKRRAGARSLAQNEKSSDPTPKTDAKPSDKQGSRFAFIRPTQYRSTFQTGPYKTQFKAAPAAKKGIQSATVDAKVIEESMGEGGYVVGPNASKSKSGELKSRMKEEPPRAQAPTTGAVTTGPGSNYRQGQGTGLPGSSQGMFLPQIVPRQSVSQSAGSFMPKYFQDFRNRNLPGSNVFPGGGFPGPGFYRPPSFSPFPPFRPFMRPDTQGPFIPHRIDFFGNTGVNYGYGPDGTYTPPTTDNGASMYGPGDGLQNTAANWQPNNRFGTYGSGAGLYGTGTGMYGAQPGESMLGNPTNVPYFGSARELELKRIKQGSSKPRLPRPKTGSSTGSASSAEGKIPNMLLSQLLSVKGEPKLYKNIRDITWSTVEVNATGFTAIAEFTSVLPPETFQCTAIVTGSKISNVMRLNGNESDLDCTEQKLKWVPAPPLQAASSGTVDSRNPVASRGLDPILGYQGVMREPGYLGMYANKYDQAINPEPYGYPYFQYVENPYGLYMG